jgi:tetratricopeptide (TPR) repeat protein
VARRLLAIGVIVAVAAVAAVVGMSRWRQAEARARVPQPPAIERPEAVVGHLSSRYAAATEAPTSIEAVGPLCVAYHADMFYDHAERCYAVASNISGGDWRWTYYRALIQAERGGGRELVSNLRRVTEMAPRFGPAWLRLGEAEFKAGRYDEAAEAWRRAGGLEEPEPSPASPRHVTEVPLSSYASFGLARVAMIRGESDRAREILERVISEAPQFGPAFRLLAESYVLLGRQADADRAVYRASRQSPYAPYSDPLVDELARESRNSILLLRLSSEASLVVNAEWAEFLTRRALEFDPDNPDVVVKLGRILRTVGRNDEALPYFERYHAMVPGDYQGLAHIGSCLSALGRFAEAESYLRRALAGQADPTTHYNLGLLLAVTGRLDEAVVEYRRALDRDPIHSDARLNLSSTLARQGRIDAAAGELLRLVEDDPENAVARTNLGLVLLQQGQVARAKVHLEEALRLEPRLAPAAEALATLR